MKTTIGIPDDLYPTLAAASSAAGVSLEGFVLSAAREKAGGSAVETSSGLASCNAKKSFGDFIAENSAWLSSLSKEEREEFSNEVAEIQAIIDEEFSKIDPRDWE